MLNNLFRSSSRTTVIYIIFLAVTVLSSYGYFAGISGRTKKDGFTKGCECHGNAPFNNVNVSISGPDTISPGQTVNFLLSITGGPLTRGGTDIAVSRGELNTIPGSGLRKLDGELTHEQPKPPSQGSVSFSFSYTAPPSEGIDTLFANGNSVNFDMLPYNDNWNYAANKILFIKSPIGIQVISSETPEMFSLEQNYPNPFNPATKIKFSVLRASRVTLRIYDIMSRGIAELINEDLGAGMYSYDFNAGNLPSGIYLYRLSTGEYSDTKRMVLVK